MFGKFSRFFCGILLSVLTENAAQSDDPQEFFTKLVEALPDAYKNGVNTTYSYIIDPTDLVGETDSRFFIGLTNHDYFRIMTSSPHTLTGISNFTATNISVSQKGDNFFVDFEAVTSGMDFQTFYIVEGVYNGTFYAGYHGNLNFWISKNTRRFHMVFLYDSFRKKFSFGGMKVKENITEGPILFEMSSVPTEVQHLVYAYLHTITLEVYSAIYKSASLYAVETGVMGYLLDYFQNNKEISVLTSANSTLKDNSRDDPQEFFNKLVKELPDTYKNGVPNNTYAHAIDPLDLVGETDVRFFIGLTDHDYFRIITSTPGNLTGISNFTPTNISVTQVDDDVYVTFDAVTTGINFQKFYIVEGVYNGTFYAGYHGNLNFWMSKNARKINLVFHYDSIFKKYSNFVTYTVSDDFIDGPVLFELSSVPKEVQQLVYDNLHTIAPKVYSVIYGTPDLVEGGLILKLLDYLQNN